MIKQRITTDITTALATAFPDVAAPEFVVEQPRNPEHGDYAVNAAMPLAKPLGIAPIQIAQEIAANLSGSLYESVQVAPPGFINLRLNAQEVAAYVPQILEQGEAFGATDSGRGKRALVEYVSANPNGPLTLGHGRNGVLGDVLARVFAKAGWNVDTEFYSNDSLSSLQMQLFAESVKAHYLGQSLPEGGYKGEYVKEIAEILRREHGDNLAEGDPTEVRNRFQQLGMEVMNREQSEDFAEFRLHFDTFVSEQKLHQDGAVVAAIEALKAGGHTYENEGALWLRSTDFGDDKDRPIVRSNGEPTYISADAAYHKNKYDRGYDLMINVWGADHHGYVPRMRAVVHAMGYDPDKLILLIYQLVRLWRGGEEVKMSTRAGEFVTLREVLDEVGVDVARFFFLMRSHDTMLDFDLDLAKKQSDENPVFYVQYAHARICSILRKAELEGHGRADATARVPPPVHLLSQPAEKALILKLLELPDEVDRIVRDLTPHRLTTYATETARVFHLFYDQCKVIDPTNADLTSARLALCYATRQTLRNTFDLIGISAPERMERE